MSTSTAAPPTSIDERALTARLQYVEVNGARLAYTESGAGEPVILVHGNLADLTLWEPITRLLAERYRVISYSRRYAWPNAPIDDAASDNVALHAEDLATLIEQLEAAPAHLVGNSWGGFICLVVARDRPELVRSLVVQEPPVVPLFVGSPPSPPALLKTLLTRPRVGRVLAGAVVSGIQPTQAAVKKGDIDKSVDILLRRVAFGDAGYQELPAWMKDHMKPNVGTHVSQQLRKDGGFVPFSPRDARSLRQPTLVMTGAKSPELQRVLSDELLRLLPNAETVRIEGASHAMHVVNPADTVDAILRFLAGPAQRGGL